MGKAKPKPAWDPKIVLREIPDAAWARIEPVLDEYGPPARTGRPGTVDFRTVPNAAIFRPRSGLPVEPAAGEAWRRQPRPPRVPGMGAKRRL